MKVTLIPRSRGWMLLRIETDLVCMIRISISGAFPPFREMYTWLGRIRDCQLPAEMIIDEEGYGVVLIAKQAKENIEFSIRGWLKNEDIIYLKTVVDPTVLVKSFHQEIVSLIENEIKSSFLVEEQILNWDSLLEKPNQPGDWNRRLAIYGGAEGNYKETSLDNFSITLRQEYLLNLRDGIRQISEHSFLRRSEMFGKLVSIYQELAIDIALDTIDPDWYERELERLNTKYNFDEVTRWKPRKERIEEHKKLISLRKARLKTLSIGQIVDGTIIGLRSYGFWVDIGGLNALLHISQISLLTIENPRQVFKLNDWVRAIIVSLDPEKGRVGISTKDLESEPGQMLTEPWTVYQNAEVMAQKYKKENIG